MKRLFAMLVVILAGIPSTARAQLPPRLPASVAGLGEVTPPGCDTGAYKIPFTAASDGGALWLLARPAAVGVACEGIVYGAALVFAGAWHPAAGGCINELGGSGARICIGATSGRGARVGVPFTLCPDARRCWSGTASVARI